MYPNKNFWPKQCFRIVSLEIFNFGKNLLFNQLNNNNQCGEV